MLHSSPFHFRKPKRSPRDCCDRKQAGCSRFRDVSHMKLTDIFKSLRHRRLRRNDTHHRRASLTHSRSLPPSRFADHHHHNGSPGTRLAQPPLPDFAASPSLQVSCTRFDAVNLSSSATEGYFDFSSGMSTSSLGLVESSGSPNGARGPRSSSRCVSSFPTSPSAFHLRSTSTKDYLVERLERRLRRLSLGDASFNPDRVALLNDPSRDIPMDVCVTSPGASLQRIANPEASSCFASDAPDPKSFAHDLENAVPTILITSVDAKHAKPLPPSAQRPPGPRAPFSPSNLINSNNPTNILSAESKLEKTTLPPDDPFTTHPHGAAYPSDYNLVFRLPLPVFRSVYRKSSAAYAPETPTPKCCDHVGDCRGDLWEVLHPPLIADTFTLPPFRLPPLSTDLFR